MYEQKRGSSTLKKFMISNLGSETGPKKRAEVELTGLVVSLELLALALTHIKLKPWHLLSLLI